jgi:hypothetical protein
MGLSEEDIRAITIEGNLYWMPKATAEALISEFVKKLQKLYDDNTFITHDLIFLSELEELIKEYEEKLK